jgi:hypothetical protein
MVLFVKWFIKCTFCRRHGLELKLKLERRGEGSLIITTLLLKHYSPPHGSAREKHQSKAVFH